MLVLLSHPRAAKVTAKGCDEGLVKMGKAFNLWVKGMSRKHVLIDGKVLHQKALSLYKAFSKGSPEMHDTKPFSASEEMVHRFRNTLGSLLKKSHLMIKHLLLHILQN